ncbi:hypothetical protein FTUN_3861 [Frigoriglobus tundricola]|uniref:Uncharacterized protein n=1 Tax=Frigoriglobus tundricola TaxID=2774151 RepID=A0A6M5YSB1_9BACT|nr:hypothetical protein FTUN_3861 [Frigoriglobus tundricola]
MWPGALAQPKKQAACRTTTRVAGTVGMKQKVIESLRLLARRPFVQFRP